MSEGAVEAPSETSPRIGRAGGAGARTIGLHSREEASSLPRLAPVKPALGQSAYIRERGIVL